MGNFKIFKHGDTSIQFNYSDTNEIKVVYFICEYLRDEVYNRLTKEVEPYET